MGSRWRVGSGDSIRVVENGQIPKPNSFKIQDHPLLANDFRVLDLRFPNGCRDLEFISHFFSKEETKLILILLVRTMEHDDIKIWHPTKDGEFMVNSGYKTALLLKPLANTLNP